MDATRSGENVVRTFLSRLEDDDVDGALELLDEEAEWVNLSLPTIRGRDEIGRVLRLLPRTGVRFRAHVHHVAEREGVVLTERTDGLGRGRFEQRFWVYGRFEVVDGRITLWRDSFDWSDLARSFFRGIAGAVTPRANRTWPGGPAGTSS